MELFDAFNTRKTIRKYKETTPPTEDIKRIINAARVAPSATNSQNWKFVAVLNKDLKQKMAAAVAKKYDEIMLWNEAQDLLPQLKGSKAYSVFFENAPCVIAAIEYPRFSDTNELFKRRGLTLSEYEQARPDSSLLSMGAAIENISLAAHGLGYGTCWMCAPIVAYKELKELLNIEASAKIVSLIALGFPQDETPSQPTKKSLDDIMEII
ncbi:MAG: nitroreductase family protein [Candidatus Gastranaerophilales bacterium]|nr:nitroreductase family protein [Candidatus Gastranaerophilales bacterium]